jgi:hypothetical protein
MKDRARLSRQRAIGRERPGPLSQSETRYPARRTSQGLFELSSTTKMRVRR